MEGPPDSENRTPWSAPNGLAACLMALALTACGSGDAPPPAESACLTGPYELENGEVLAFDVYQSGELRWRALDGRSGLLREEDGAWTGAAGWSGEPDGVTATFGECGSGEIVFAGTPGARMALETVETAFESGGETLAARLILPAGEGPVPVAVHVHGSEDYSAIDYAYLPWMMAAQGVGVMVYDKRGTGYSTGTYSQDFELLAGDAAAAAGEARRLGGERVGAIGFFGGSQAGWIIPLAAQKVPADFLIVGYGMAYGPLSENHDETVAGLRAQGVSEEDLAKASEFADAAGEVMASRFRSGFGRLGELKKQYRGEAWFEAMEGEFSGSFARAPNWGLRLFGMFRRNDTSWRHDPLPALQALSAPTLWILAEEDREAPPEATRERLVAVAAAGAPLTVAQFPDADHGMLEFTTGPDGQRIWTRHPEGYFGMMGDFAMDGRLDGEYPRAEILAAPD